MNPLETLLAAPGTLVILVPVVGLIVGSFLNVVIYRLPKIMENNWRRECCELLEQPEPEQEPLGLAFPNSRCPHCGTPIKPWHNIPVLGYLMLRGKCAACGAPISVRYPLVELATGLLGFAAVQAFGATPQMFAAVMLLWALVVLTGIDIDTQLLPDSITLPLLWLGLLFNLNGVFTDLESSVVGAVAGYMTLWSVYWAFKLATGKEGMGYGDFKLLAALGAWFGWQALPLIILLSSVVGAALGILLMILAKRGKEVPMPFGPYLAGAGALWLFFGEVINSRYLAAAGL